MLWRLGRGSPSRLSSTRSSTATHRSRGLPTIRLDAHGCCLNVEFFPRRARTFYASNSVTGGVCSRPEPTQNHTVTVKATSPDGVGSLTLVLGGGLCRRSLSRKCEDIRACSCVQLRDTQPPAGVKTPASRSEACCCFWWLYGLRWVLGLRE